MMRPLAATLALTLAATTLAPSARAVVIDDFSVGPIALADTPGGSYATATQTSLDPSHVAGGARAWTFSSRQQTGSAPAPDAAVRMSVSNDPAPHYLYQAEQFLTASNFLLRYDAQNAGAGAPGINLNLAAQKHNAVQFDVAFANFTSQGLFDVWFQSPSTGQTITSVKLPISATPYRAFALLSNTKGVAPDALSMFMFGTSNGNLWGSFQLDRIVTASTADADFDGDVDGADLLHLQQSFGTVLPTTASSQDRVAAGDANLDGTINKDDLTILRNCFTPPIASPSAAVPEPAAARLLAALASLLARPSSRFRHRKL